MTLKRCSHGHYYDAERYSVCPHCNGNFEEEGYSSEGGYSSNYKDILDGDDSGTMPADPPYAANPPYSVKPPFPTDPGYNNMDGGPRQDFPGNSDDSPVRPFQGAADNAQSFPNFKYDVPTDPASFDPDEDEKTTPLYYGGRIPKPAGQKNTVQPARFNPVVGWLVCIEGKHLGKAFPLFTGKNFIGRSIDMDVCLENDLSISRNKHAIIVFEPMRRLFFAQPGEGHELFYVNDNVILASTQLKARDVISIGLIKLMFVPFCDEKFGWDEVKLQEDE